jgi:ZIP family zinc transporter
MIDALSWRPSDPALLAIGVVTGLATAFGGLITLRFHSRLALLRSFSAGAVLGVALFDLLPEALELGAGAHSPAMLTACVAIGFAIYALAHAWSSGRAADGRQRAGDLGPASLTVHSLTDGLGIGLAFQVSAAVGVIVAVAVLAHDVVDGANTVTLSLVGGGSTRRARGWLIADTLAPLAGIAASRFVIVPKASLAIALAVFAGFFLHIGTSHGAEGSVGPPKLASAAASLLGMAFIFVIVRLAG